MIKCTNHPSLLDTMLHPQILQSVSFPDNSMVDEWVGGWFLYRAVTIFFKGTHG